MTNAGHPPPLWYRASRDEWTCLETQRASQRKRPLRLLADVTYNHLVIKPQSGDLIVPCSDGVSEARAPAGVELGRDGLMDMVRALSINSPEEIDTQLVSALRAFGGDRETPDDETIIVVAKNDK